MNANEQSKTEQPKTSRESVKENMEKSTEEQPGEFRDEANEDKVVEIGKDVTKNPIKGIDPKE